MKVLIAWSVVAVLGFALAFWAKLSLPPGTDERPIPITYRTSRGPYRFLRHPMYLGNLMLVTGLAGIGGGFWVALSVGILAEMVMAEWVGREEGRDPRS